MSHRRLLTRPEVTILRDGADVVAAHVKLRNGRASHVIRPNPNVGVFFYIGSDGFPVGLKFFEPVSGVAVTEIIDTLISGPDGEPQGVGTVQRHHFLTDPCDITVAVNGIRQALKLLPDHIVPA